MRIPTIGLVFHLWMGPKGPNILTVFSTVIHSIQVFGSLQAQSWGLGQCKRDSNCISKHLF